MKRIRKGDKVIIIAGKSRGYIGNVLYVLNDKVIVEGGNLVKKHVKPNAQNNERGGIITIEAALHLSNVALYNSAESKAGKVGFKVLVKDGAPHKVRYFKSNNELIDQA